MRLPSFSVVVLGILGSGSCQQLAQDLATAISNYTDLSSFRSALTSFPSLFDSVLPSSPTGVTVLIPSDDAFQKFLNQTGTELTSLPFSLLVATLQYHVLDAEMTSANFTAPRGVTVPTLLTDQQYNNRSAGAELIDTYGENAAKGQVLFISPDPISPARLRVRQPSRRDTNVNLRGGLGQGGVMTAVDGVWTGGYFQVIDTVMSPPMPCSNTIRGLAASLSSLDNALNRTNLWDTLNTTPNVTCLAPDNNAFQAAGNPDANLDPSHLSSALLFHTLPMPLYSNYLTDGLALASVGGPIVTVRILGNDTYFNDAKVVSPNVLTNNGLVHVLDRVMSPNGTAPSSSSTASGGTATATKSASATPSQSGKSSGASSMGVAGSAMACSVVVLVSAVVGF